MNSGPAKVFSGCQSSLPLYIRDEVPEAHRLTICDCLTEGEPFRSIDSVAPDVVESMCMQLPERIIISLCIRQLSVNEASNDISVSTFEVSNLVLVRDCDGSARLEDAANFTQGTLRLEPVERAKARHSVKQLIAVGNVLGGADHVCNIWTWLFERLIEHSLVNIGTEDNGSAVGQLPCANPCTATEIKNQW